MKRCECGNTISLDRQSAGIDHCPACDPHPKLKELDILIYDMEVDLTGKLDCHDVMKAVIQLAKYIREWQ